MTRQFLSCMIFPLFSLASGCSGRSLGSSTDRPDGSTPAQPDGTVTTGFCSGQSKLDLDGRLLTPVAVTAEELIMDCCGGAILHLHTAVETGHDFVIMIRAAGGPIPEGEYPLPDPDMVMSVEIWESGPEPAEPRPLSGTFVVLGQPTYDDPLVLTVCGSTGDLGPYASARVWTGQVVVAPWGWQDRFTFSLLSDPAVDAVEAASRPLASLELDPEPVLTLVDIAWYSGSTHTIRWSSVYWYQRLFNRLEDVGVRGIPFVVTADGERIYMGAFMTSLSSYAFEGPAVVVEDITETQMSIQAGYPGSMPEPPDPRADPRIVQVLTESNKLAP